MLCNYVKCVSQNAIGLFAGWLKLGLVTIKIILIVNFLKIND